MKKIVIVAGAFGSGKSEYSANLAYKLGKGAVIIDMDIMNPYFRTRELTDKFAKLGIEIVAPEGKFRYTELPMLSPKIHAKITDEQNPVIIDVGGDPVGMKVLGRYKDALKKRGYDLRMVINTKRPFTSNSEDIATMFEEFEQMSGLKITTLVSNTNLMEYTNAEIIEEGVNIISEVAKQKEVIFDHYCVLAQNAKGVPEQINDQKIFLMDYFLNKPWERC